MRQQQPGGAGQAPGTAGGQAPGGRRSARRAGDAAHARSAFDRVTHPFKEGRTAWCPQYVPPRSAAAVAAIAAVAGCCAAAGEQAAARRSLSRTQQAVCQPSRQGPWPHCGQVWAPCALLQCCSPVSADPAGLVAGGNAPRVLQAPLARQSKRRVDLRISKASARPPLQQAASNS